MPFFYVKRVGSEFDLYVNGGYTSTYATRAEATAAGQRLQALADGTAPYTGWGGATPR